jgi:hypothetical protein
VLEVFYYTHSRREEILAQTISIEKIPAQLGHTGHQHRDPVTVPSRQYRILIHIPHPVPEVQLGLQVLQGLQHICAQMAALPHENRQFARQHSTRATGGCRRSVRIRHLDGEEGGVTLALHQHGNGSAGRQGIDQLAELLDTGDGFIIDAEDDVTLADARP